MLRRDSFALASWLVVFAWLTGSATAFWFFELSDWRAFSESQARALPPVNPALVEQWFRSAVQCPHASRRRRGFRPFGLNF
jgi:hypothetical protein